MQFCNTGKNSPPTVGFLPSGFQFFRTEDTIQPPPSFAARAPCSSKLEIDRETGPACCVRIMADFIDIPCKREAGHGIYGSSAEVR
jgi:hypothetical protein